MKIVLAIDSFKGSLSSFEIINIISEELKVKNPEIEIVGIPMADGGEGSLDVIIKLLPIKKIECVVHNPFFKKVKSYYGFDSSSCTAYIELAKVSGLELVSNCLDVMNASTFGTGEIMLDALKRGTKKIILFVGGSATNDAGIGIAAALGLRFIAKAGNELKPLGKNLSEIELIDDSKSDFKNYNCVIEVAADVNNPFYGTNGAAHIYAKQKGASINEIKFLDNGLKHISNIFSTRYNMDLQSVAGSGAAGGVSGGLVAMFNATLVSGTSLILEISKFEDKIASADIVITGEGKIDSQTLNGKLLSKVTNLAKRHHKKTIAICGFFDGDDNLKRDLHLDEIYSLAKVESEIPDAILNSKALLRKTIHEMHF
jgi:glycerate kinase